MMAKIAPVRLVPDLGAIDGLASIGGVDVGDRD